MNGQPLAAMALPDWTQSSEGQSSVVWDRANRLAKIDIAGGVSGCAARDSIPE